MELGSYFILFSLCIFIFCILVILIKDRMEQIWLSKEYKAGRFKSFTVYKLRSSAPYAVISYADKTYRITMTTLKNGRYKQV